MDDHVFTAATINSIFMTLLLDGSAIDGLTTLSPGVLAAIIACSIIVLLICITSCLVVLGCMKRYKRQSVLLETKLVQYLEILLKLISKYAYDLCIYIYVHWLTYIFNVASYIYGL